MIIAIDGPAASGKGTVAKKLAEKLCLAFLDTGLTYRAAAKTVLDKRISPFNRREVALAIANINLTNMSDAELRTPEISNVTPIIAEIVEVREILGALQREFAHNPPAHVKGAILDGRDIGTVICPDADVKLFLTADLYARANRRHRELIARGLKTSFPTVHRDLRRRDQQDAARAIAPLRAAEDAIVLDTTSLSIDQAYERALAIVMEKMPDIAKQWPSTKVPNA